MGIEGPLEEDKGGGGGGVVVEKQVVGGGGLEVAKEGISEEGVVVV